MIYFIQYFAESVEMFKDQGAYINCWVNAPSEFCAIELCEKIIADKKWKILNKLFAYPVTPSFYNPETEGYEYYKLALTEDCVIVYYSWFYSSSRDAKAAKEGRKVRVTLQENFQVNQ